MNKVFNKNIHKYVLVFFYDILIYSMTSEEHFHHLEEILTMLGDLPFLAKMSNCEFSMTELLYLDNVIY